MVLTSNTSENEKHLTSVRVKPPPRQTDTKWAALVLEALGTAWTATTERLLLPSASMEVAVAVAVVDEEVAIKTKVEKLLSLWNRSHWTLTD